MLIIPIKEGENIDRALKRYKRSLIKQELSVNCKHVNSLLSLLLLVERKFKSTIHSIFKRSREYLSLNLKIKYQALFQGFFVIIYDIRICIMVLLNQFKDYLLLEKKYALLTVDNYERDIIQFFKYLDIKATEYQLKNIDYGSIRLWIVV